MMPSAELPALEALTGFLTVHRETAYGVLFLGAFFETLIPFSLAVLGEIFFLSGALLAGIGTLDLWAVMGVLYAGGVLGDNASYWLGRHWGGELFQRLARWPLIGRLLRPEQFDKGSDFFRRHGALAVFTARLAGPLSWVMPALAGTFRLHYPTFLAFNTLGILLGIGQFIVLGYVFGSQLDTLLAWLQRYGPALAAFALAIMLGIAWRCYRWTASK
jgi:membrane-associated protein